MDDSGCDLARFEQLPRRRRLASFALTVSARYNRAMTKEQLLGEANSLSSRDRLELAIDLWDTVENEADFPPVSESQRAELDRRLDAYLADPSETLPADQVLDELEREL